MHQIDLIEYLVLTTSARFISDLPESKHACLGAISSIDDPSEFTIEEWNDAGTYLSCSYRRQGSPAAAKQELVQALMAA